MNNSLILGAGFPKCGTSSLWVEFRNANIGQVGEKSQYSCMNVGGSDRVVVDIGADYISEGRLDKSFLRNNYAQIYIIFCIREPRERITSSIMYHEACGVEFNVDHEIQRSYYLKYVREFVKDLDGSKVAFVDSTQFENDLDAIFNFFNSEYQCSGTLYNESVAKVPLAAKLMILLNRLSQKTFERTIFSKIFLLNVIKNLGRPVDKGRSNDIKLDSKIDDSYSYLAARRFGLFGWIDSSEI